MSQDLDRVIELAASSANVREVEVDGHIEKFVVIPREYQKLSFDRLAHGPRRIKEHREFSTFEGYQRYVEDFMNPRTATFCDRKAMSFGTVIDHHHASEPAWCEHVALFKPTESTEMAEIRAVMGTRLSQRRMAEWLEDHADYIAEDLAPLVEGVRKVQVKRKADSLHESRDRGESRKIDESLDLEGDYPETMTFVVPLHFRGDAYSLKVRMRAVVGESAGKPVVEFIFTLPNLEAAYDMEYRKLVAGIPGKTYE